MRFLRYPIRIALALLVHLFLSFAPLAQGAPRKATMILLDSTATRQQRIAAAQALGKSRDPLAVHTLVQALDTRDEQLRDAIVAALRTLKAVPILIAQMDNAAAPSEAQVLAARGLRHLRDKQAVPGLLQALKSPNRDLKVEACLALGLLQAPEASEALSAVLRSDADPRVRYHAANALGYVRTASVKAALEQQLLHERDEDVKWMVKAALRRHAAAP